MLKYTYSAVPVSAISHHVDRQSSAVNDVRWLLIALQLELIPHEVNIIYTICICRPYEVVYPNLHMYLTSLARSLGIVNVLNIAIIGTDCEYVS